MATPALVPRARRFESPARQFINAKLEPVHQPIYSAAAFDNAAIPRSVLFFQYPIGGTVTGAGTGTIGGATVWHTNLETAGFLATPKLYLVQGFRVIPHPLAAGSAAGAAPSLKDDEATTGLATPDTDAQLQDIMFLWYTGVFHFTVGPKNYLKVPLWNVPGNTGMEGFAGIGLSQNAPGASSISFQRSRVIQPVGRYFSLPQYPILIPSQQSFNAEIQFPLPTNPTLVADSWVFCQLDGILGREVA